MCDSSPAPKNVERRATRRRLQSGSSILELALYLLPAMALIISFVNLGLALFSWVTLQNAVREGSRYAITYQTDSSGTQVQSIKDATANAALGLVSSTATVSTAGSPPYVQVKFFLPPTATDATATDVTGQTGQNNSGNIVQVSVQNYPLTWLAPITGTSGTNTSPFWTASSSLIVNTYSLEVLGGAPTGGIPPP